MSYVQAKRSPIKSVIAALSLAGGLVITGPVAAGEDTGLQTWVRDADAAIDDVMVFPAYAAKRGHSGRSVFTVTVDRSGNVIDSEMVTHSGISRLKSAAKTVLRKVEFPALPANYDSQELRFSLRLSYINASSPAAARALERRTLVRSEKLASGRPVAGRITVLSSAAD